MAGQVAYEVTSTARFVFRMGRIIIGREITGVKSQICQVVLPFNLTCSSGKCPEDPVRKTMLIEQTVGQLDRQLGFPHASHANHTYWKIVLARAYKQLLQPRKLTRPFLE